MYGKRPWAHGISSSPCWLNMALFLRKETEIAIFCGDIHLHRPYIGLRYLHFRILKFPLNEIKTLQNKHPQKLANNHVLLEWRAMKYHWLSFTSSSTMVTPQLHRDASSESSSVWWRHRAVALGPTGETETGTSAEARGEAAFLFPFVLSDLSPGSIIVDVIWPFWFSCSSHLMWRQISD